MSHCRWMAAFFVVVAATPLHAQVVFVPAQPPPIVIPRGYEYDLSGIDLDVEPAEKLDPRWPNVPRAPKKEPAPPHKPMPPADDNAQLKREPRKELPPKAPPPPKEKDQPNLE